MYSHAFFDSPYGRCAIAWSERGIVALQLPEKSDAQTRKKLERRAVGTTLAEPTPAVRAAIEDVLARLRGAANSLEHIELDLAAGTRAIYDAVRAIPLGETRLGLTVAGAAPRTVAKALAENPLAILLPSHRVLDAQGRIAQLAHNGSVATRMRLLMSEAAHVASHFEGGTEFAFAVDEAVAHLRTDPAMARLIDRVGPFAMKIRRAPSIFAALAESIVYQQLSGRAAATIFARVRALFPNGHVGPTPAQLLKASDAALRGAGLSRNKLLALRDLAKRATDGTIPTLTEAASLDDEALIERLTTVRGIGRWTVEMLLMFRLGRPDLLPVDDLGVRKGLGVMLGKREMPTIDALAKRGERWRPYRTAASWYLWRATELPTKSARPS